MKDITIEMTVAEALTALGPIQDRALESSRLAANATGDEREILDLSSKMLNRVATRIVDALYPNCGATYPHEWHRGCGGVPGEIELGLVS
jgi:hypothetical protein